MCTITMHVESDRNVAIKVRTACSNLQYIHDTGLPLECLAVLENKMTGLYVTFSICGGTVIS